MFTLLPELEERSVSYPNITGWGFGWQAERGVGCGNGEIIGDDPAAAWQTMLNTCGEAPAATVQVLTSEMLVQFVTEEFFWSALGAHAASVGREAVVVLYLRDPFSLFLSAYAQEVKAVRFSGTLEEWVDGFQHYMGSVPYRHLDVMDDLARRHGCRLRIFRYEDAGMNLVEHFLERGCGVSIAGLTVQDRRMNPSLSPYDCSFHRGVNAKCGYLGELLRWERMDSITLVPSSGEPGLFELSREGEARLDQFFGVYRSLLTEFTDFADRVDYTIDRSRVTERYTAEEAGIHLKFFELGQMVANSWAVGYINWDFTKKLEQAKAQQPDGAAVDSQ